jgi:hypothetical protein
VHSNFARDWVENRLKNDIADVLNCLLGEALALRFIVANSVENGSDARAHVPAAQMPPPEELRLGGTYPRFRGVRSANADRI